MASNSYRAGPTCLSVVTPIDPATCLPDETVDSFVVPMCADWEITDVLTDDVDFTATGALGPCGPILEFKGVPKYKEITFRFATQDFFLESALMGNAVSVDLNLTGDAVGIQRLIQGSGSPCGQATLPAISLAIIRKVGLCGSSGACAPVSATGGTNCVLEILPYITNIRRSAGTFTRTDANEAEYTGIIYPLGAGVPGPFMGHPGPIQAGAVHIEHFIDCNALPVPSCDGQPYPF